MIDVVMTSLKGYCVETDTMTWLSESYAVRRVSHPLPCSMLTIGKRCRDTERAEIDMNQRGTIRRGHKSIRDEFGETLRVIDGATWIIWLKTEQIASWSTEVCQWKRQIGIILFDGPITGERIPRQTLVSWILVRVIGSTLTDS